MSKPLNPTVERLGMALLKRALFHGTLLASCLVAVLLMQLERTYKIKAAGFAAALVFILGLCLSFFTVPEVIERMKSDNTMLLRDAVAHTFYSYLMCASFIPVIGPFLGRRFQGRDKENPFTQDEE